GHYFYGIRKYFQEEIFYLLFGTQSMKRYRPFERKEEGAGKTSIRVWQRNHHIVSSWPNMQRVFLNFKRPIFICRNVQFLISIINIMLRILKTIMLKLVL